MNNEKTEINLRLRLNLRAVGKYRVSEKLLVNTAESFFVQAKLSFVFTLIMEENI